jgi:hypothetical protein
MGEAGTGYGTESVIVKAGQEQSRGAVKASKKWAEGEGQGRIRNQGHGRRNWKMAGDRWRQK